MRSVWKGSISFGLVAIPIELYTATEEHKVAFHQVHADDGGRIRYRRFCTVGGEEVPYSEIAKGYELPDGEMVILTDEDFADLPLASRREIEVLSFVDAGSIDPVQLTRSYHCAPTERGVKPYVLLRDALARAEKVAMVKVAVRSRESLAALRPRGKGLVLQLMHWPDEVREPELSFVDDVRLRPQEVEVAGAYVEALSGDVDPGQLVDRYRVALNQLIEAKVAGRQVEQPPAAAMLNGGDLMDALRRSIEAAKGSRAARARKPAAKRAAGKTATAGSQRDPAKKSTTARKKAPAKKAPAKKAPAKKATAKKSAAKKSAAK